MSNTNPPFSNDPNKTPPPAVQIPGQMPPAMPMPVMSYASPDVDRANLFKIAKRQREVNLLALLQIALFVVNQVLSPMVITMAQQGGKPSPIAALILLGVSVCLFGVWIATVVYLILFATCLDKGGTAVLMGVLSVIPCFNLVIVIIQSQRATGRLRKAGYKVGLLGANLKQFAQ